MQGKISAFYGAKAVADNGQPAGEFANKTPVEIVEPSGKPSWHVGEWTKVSNGTLTGWVAANQVEYNYGN